MMLTPTFPSQELLESYRGQVVLGCRHSSPNSEK
jgi:hypothetical protein